MENEFVPYELALELKKLGFDEPCFGFYRLGDVDIYYGTIIQRKNHKFRNNTELNIYGDLKEKIAAPTYSQAFRFFRNKYDASPIITCQSELGNSWKYHIPNTGGEMDFETYEEAELACLKKLIEIVNNGDNK